MPGPLISGIASLVLPGSGQLLNRRYIRGGLLMGTWIVASSVMMVLTIGLALLVHLVFMGATAVDAYRLAKSSVPVQ